MKLLSSIKYLLLALPLALSFTACDDDGTDPIVPGEAVTGAQLYFAQKSKTVTLSQGQTTIPFTVYRSNTTEAATVTINATVDAPQVFEVQTSVNFVAGERMAEGVVNVNFDEIVDGEKYTILLNVPSGSDTPYGCPEMLMTITYENWISLGTGTYFDGMLDVIYGYDAPKYEVEIQENGSVSGYYRVVNPYGPDTWGKHTNLDITNTNWEEGEHYFYIHAENPDAVYFDTQELGLYIDDSGSIEAWSNVSYYMAYGYTLEDVIGKGLVGTYDKTKGIIDIGKGNVGLNFEYWGRYSPSSFSGYIKIVLPGFIACDYTASIEYKGRTVHVDGTVQHMAQVELSDDVENAEVYLLYENSLASDVVTITESGEVTLTMMHPDKSGNYTLVVDAYGAGLVQASDSEVIYYTPEGGTPFTLEQLVGTYTVDASYAWGDDINPTVTISASEEYPGWILMSDLYFKGSEVWCKADYGSGILCVPNWGYMYDDGTYYHYIYNWNGPYDGYFPMLMHSDGTLTMDSAAALGIYSYYHFSTEYEWEGYWDYSYVFNLTKVTDEVPSTNPDTETGTDTTTTGTDVVTSGLAPMNRNASVKVPCPNASPAKAGRIIKPFGKPMPSKIR